MHPADLKVSPQGPEARDPHWLSVGGLQSVGGGSGRRYGESERCTGPDTASWLKAWVAGSAQMLSFENPEATDSKEMPLKKMKMTKSNSRKKEDSGVK